MHLLRIDASIRRERSASSALADLVLHGFTAARPDVPVVSRHLGQDPLPADAWEAAVTARLLSDADRSPTQRKALHLAEQVAAELDGAVSAVLALPLYNFGVSQHVKTWIDLVAVGTPHGMRPLEGTPTALVITRGGAYGPGTPRHGWDYNTGFLRRILADVWGADLTVIEREFTGVGLDPALDEFVETAELMRQNAEMAAVEAGTRLAVRLAA